MGVCEEWKWAGALVIVAEYGAAGVVGAATATVIVAVAVGFAVAGSGGVLVVGSGASGVAAVGGCCGLLMLVF